MRSNFLLGSLCAMFQNGAVANQPVLNPVGDSPPLEPAGADVVRRDVDTECVSSVYSELWPPAPTPSALASWAISAEVTISQAPCTITVPAALAKDYLDYMDDLSSWGANLESEAAAIDTDCGLDTYGLNLSILCTGSRTVVFTGATGTNSTPTAVASTTILEAVNYPTGTILIGEGSKHCGVAGVAVFVAVLVSAFVVTL